MPCELGMTRDTTDLRRSALDEWIESIGDVADAPDGIIADAGAELLADIVLDGDQAGAQHAVDRFRALLARWRDRDSEWDRTIGAVHALMAVAAVVAARVPSQRSVTTVGAGTNAHRMLRELAGRSPVSGSTLAKALDVDLSEISRTGRRLLGEGSVTRTKAAQQALWEITPRGEEILELLDEVKSQEEKAPHSAANMPIAVAIEQAFDIDILLPTFDTQWRTREWNPATEWKLFHGSISGRYDRERYSRRIVLATEDLKVTRASLQHWTDDADRLHESVDRSRLLFYGLWTERFDAVLERLRLWGSLHDFAQGTPDFFVPDPRASAKEVRATFGAMLQQFGVRADAVWPASSLPLWDGYAIVPGKSGEKGLVLFEAKSQPEELEVRLPTPRRDDRRRAFSAAVNMTARAVTEQSRRWHASRYADPVERLTLLRLLRETGVETWINNVYFVDPEGQYGELPPSEDAWTRYLGKAQKALDIGNRHVFASYVRNDFYVAPPVSAVGGEDPDE